MDGSVSCSVKLKLKPEFCRRHKSRNLVLFFFFVSFVLDNSSLDGEVQSHPLARSRVRQPFYRWGCFFSRRDTVFFEGGEKWRTNGASARVTFPQVKTIISCYTLRIKNTRNDCSRYRYIFLDIFIYFLDICFQIYFFFFLPFVIPSDWNEMESLSFAC